MTATNTRYNILYCDRNNSVESASDIKVSGILYTIKNREHWLTVLQGNTDLLQA